MTRQEFLTAWAVLVAGLGFEVPRSQTELYWNRLSDLPDGAFTRAIQSILESPDFADYARFRRLPTLHELREEAEAKAQAQGKTAYVGGVPLQEYLDRIRNGDGGGAGNVSREDAATVVDRVAQRARAGGGPRLLGPGNAGHAALARADAVREIPATQLTDEEWDARRRRLLEQAEQLAGDVVRRD